MNYSMLNGLTLAYMGDSFYENAIREYLINEGITKVNDLHKQAIKFTSAKAQSIIISKMIENNFLTEEELEYFKRGRNTVGNKRKNASQQEYQYATGFETLVGILYLKKEKRVNEVINYSIDIIKGEQDEN